MMRPGFGGQRLPLPPGLCCRCGAAITEPREASVEQVQGKLRLCCRDGKACRERRKAKEEEG